jgi:hypothetical protein
VPEIEPPSRKPEITEPGGMPQPDTQVPGIHEPPPMPVQPGMPPNIIA